MTRHNLLVMQGQQINSDETVTKLISSPRRCETKTRDNVFVTLVISVQYQVQKENIYESYYRLTNSSQQISSYIFDVVRATVPKVGMLPTQNPDRAAPLVVPFRNRNE